MDAYDVKNDLHFLQWLLPTVGRETGTMISLCSRGKVGLKAQNNGWREYKLCQEGDEKPRTLRLMLEQVTTDGSLCREARAKLTSAILRLWGDDTTILTDIVYIDY
jgi:hypothetical protein